MDASKYPKMTSDDIELFDALVPTLEECDDSRRRDLLQTFMLLLACVDADSGRIDNDKLVRLVQKLGNGQFNFG